MAERESGALPHQSARVRAPADGHYPDPPTLLGLCPGVHLGEYYVPLEPDDSRTCPECSEQLVVYVVADV